MKLMLARLSADWASTWGHPVVLAESFVDPEPYRGTAYKVSGWSQLGNTRGWKRSAVSGTGRWLGSTPVQAESNEIPAARELLGKLDVVDKILLADAAHTQVATVQQILYEQGGDYLLTVKENQKNLFETLATLLTPQRFSPSANGAHPCPDPRAQPGTA